MGAFDSGLIFLIISKIKIIKVATSQREAKTLKIFFPSSTIIKKLKRECKAVAANNPAPRYIFLMAELLKNEKPIKAPRVAEVVT